MSSDGGPSGAAASPASPSHNSSSNSNPASTVDQFLVTARALCAAANFAELAEFLARSRELLERQAGNNNGLDTAMEALDVNQHAMPMMAVRTLED